MEQRAGLMNPTPRFFWPAALELDFDRHATSPAAWLAFLKQLWANDAQAIDLLQEWIGYCLLPDTGQQKILLIVGPRRSGKGTIARVLRGLVGERSYVSPTLASLGTPFGLWPLLGKSVAVISDARMSGRTDAAVVAERLLSISGEDAQTVDRKFLPPVTSRLPVRFMVLTNELPRLGDASGALAGRFLVLRLLKSFYGAEDTALTGRLLQELPGILLWAIEGLRRLLQRGRFHQPESALPLVQDLEDLSSPVSVFVRERCELGAAFKAPVRDLYAAWQNWCEANGKKDVGTAQTFGRDLRAALPDLDDSRPRTGDERVRVYVGIRLNTEVRF
jgi:putative DNA primase/helicase